MKERNDRLEDEIKWLVMRSNIGGEDPVKQVSSLHFIYHYAPTTLAVCSNNFTLRIHFALVVGPI